MTRDVLFGLAAAMAVALALDATPAAAQAGLECQRCHGEPEFLRQYVDAAAEARALTVQQGALDASAHGGMACDACHSGFTRFPHAAGATTESCQSCHEDVAVEWGGGAHWGDGVIEPVECGECHGIHDMAGTDGLGEGPAVRAMNETCVGCHRTQRLPDGAHHGGDVGCYTCHAPHGVRPPEDPESWMAPLEQPRTCGACHDSVTAVWAGDAHSRALTAGTWENADVAPPTCTSCHGAHPVLAAGDSGFAASLTHCSACHEKAAATYRGTYHGKAARLGSQVAATCSDCHGAHGIEPASDAGSRVAAGNLMETCGACHEHVRPSFVEYDSHPDPMDRERNPALFYSFWFMNTLLIVMLGVFGLHTLLWWVRIRIDERKGIEHHQGGGRE